MRAGVALGKGDPHGTNETEPVEGPGLSEAQGVSVLDQTRIVGIVTRTDLLGA